MKRFDISKIQVRKKDDTLQDFDAKKIVIAINKSADRATIELTEDQENEVVSLVLATIKKREMAIIPIATMHNFVEAALEKVDEKVAKHYRDYRNYKKEFVDMMDNVYKEDQKIRYIGDKENSNTDSAHVSTKRSLTYNELSKQLYKMRFLNEKERQAINDGFIYIHDMSARRDTMNCCLFDIGRVLSGGFEMANIWYNEPKSIGVAFDVIGDVTMNTAAQQYGGFTLPRLDQILAKYAEMSYQKYLEKYKAISNKPIEELEELATKDTVREIEQGIQAIEYKFNTVGSSRGDYPFVTVTFGLGTSKWETLISKAFLNVRENGQGKKGYKKPVLFPKLVFLFDKKLHGEGGELRWLTEEAARCSSKAMYPDYLSLTGDPKDFMSDIYGTNTVSEMYKKYGKVISPMGCRAFLSPYYPRGGFKPVDENDAPVFEGRWNGGAISLNLPMIYQKALVAEEDFYKVLDYYLELIRKIHIKTYSYLSDMKAGVNPVAYCQGGFYGGNLKPNEKIAPLVKSATFSFGITALNELQQLHNKKSIFEDNKFAKEVMIYINEKVNQFKEDDKIMYAIYGTPAESLCGKQVQQFRKKFGIVQGVSDKAYVTNSFHCHVTEDITPIQKQDHELEFWNLFNGGKIQYVKHNIAYNIKAILAYIDRAMDMGFYEGVNLALSYCNECGYTELNMDICPECKSDNLTKIERMNGYLSYSRVNGDSRLNDAKMAEIGERKSM